jgi:WD40 repeat protein
MRGIVLSPDGTAGCTSSMELYDFTARKLLSLTAEGELRSWSPNSRWLMYSNRGLCYVSRDGQINRRVTPEKFLRGAEPPMWTKDGRGILYCSSDGRFHVVDVEAQKETSWVLEPPVDHVDSVSWSWDGKWLFLKGQGPLWSDVPVGVVSRDGKTYWYVRNHTAPGIHPDFSTAGFLGPFAGLYLPRWTNDGKGMVLGYRCLTIGGVDSSNAVPQIWRFDLATGTVTPLCVIPEAIKSWDASGDGRYVAYIPEKAEPYRGGVMLWDTQTRLLTRIYDHVRIDLENTLRFSPDGKSVACMEGGKVDFLEVSAPRGRAVHPTNGPKWIGGWNAKTNSLVMGTLAGETLRWNDSTRKCERLWPPEVSPWPATVEEITTTRVPMESFATQPWREEFAQGKTNAVSAPAALTVLPVQVTVKKSY